MTQLESNSFVHQLPHDCYPPTDSDDESFVVLSRSLPADSIVEVETAHLELLSPDVIDQSLDIASEALNNVPKSSLPTTPPIPKVDFSCITTTSLSSIGSQDEIQSKVEILLQQNNNLKEILHQNNLVMKNQYQTLTEWQKDVEKVHEKHKQKFEETKKYIHELQTENQRLNALVKKENNTDFSVLNLDENKMKDEIAKKENEIKERDEIINAQKLQISNFVTLELGYKAEIKDLNGRIKELYDQIVDQQNKEAKYREEFSKKDTDFDIKEHNYLEQITSLKCSIEKLKIQEEKTEEFDTVKKQLMAAQAMITQLRESKKNTEVESEIYKKQIAEDEKEKERLMKENERITVLEQQLNIYMNDFELEKKSKENLLAENNKFVEDLHLLQLRNEELLEEISNLKVKSSFVEVNPSPSAPETSRSNPSPSPPPTTYTCPLCMEKFRSYRALEEHVEICLNNAP